MYANVLSGFITGQAFPFSFDLFYMDPTSTTKSYKFPSIYLVRLLVQFYFSSLVRLTHGVQRLN